MRKQTHRIKSDLKTLLFLFCVMASRFALAADDSANIPNTPDTQSELECSTNLLDLPTEIQEIIISFIDENGSPLNSEGLYLVNKDFLYLLCKH